MNRCYVKFLKKMLLILAALGLMHASVCAAGTLIVVSSCTYDSGFNDTAQGVTTDSDGNITVTGTSNYDYYTIKYSSDLATIISSHTYDDGEAYGVTTDNDGNIIVTGYNYEYSSDDYYTIKYSSDLATIISSHTYNNGYSDIAQAITTNSDGNIIVTGQSYNDSNSDYYTIKYSSDLATIISSHTYDRGYNDSAKGVTTDSDRNIIVTGYSNNGSTNAYYTVKYSSDLATIISSHTYDSGYNDIARAVTIDNDGNIIVTGYSNDDYYTIKYSSDLATIISSHTYDSGYNDFASAVTIDNDGNIIVTGSSNNGSNDDYYTIKYSSDLATIISSHTYNSGYNDLAYAITTDTVGNIIVTGRSNNDYYTIKYNGLLPNISDVSSGANQGETKDITITGNNFYAGAEVSFSGTGIVINSTDVVSKTQIDVNLSVLAETTTGYRDITITNIDTGTGIKAGAFEVQVGTPLAPSDFAGVAISSTEVRFTWTDNSSDEYGFRIYSSTNWMITSLSADTTMWIDNSLTANTSSYAWMVKAYYNIGGESTDSALSEVVYSSANVPGTGTFYGLAGTGFDIAWEANNNPAGTEYSVEISTDNGFLPIKSSSTWQTDRTHRFNGLTLDTTYYAQVRARNHTGIETAYTNLGSTKTLTVAQPLAPSDFAGVAISSTEVRFTWTDNSADEDGFRIYSSTNWLITSLSADTTMWIDNSLTANTSSYAWMVRAYNTGGESGGSALSAVMYSSANIPTGGYFYDRWATSATFAWNENGNREGTEYYVVISTDTNFGSMADSVWYAGSSYTFTSLVPNTTYYSRLRGRNGNNEVTEYTSSVSTITLANVPVFGEFTNVTETSLIVNWGINNNSEWTEYEVEISTTSGFDSKNTSSWQTNISSYIFTGLNLNTTYYARVKAKNSEGIETSYTNLGSTKTLNISITTVLPSVLYRGVEGATVTITGKGFETGASVSVLGGGIELSTQSVSSTEISILVSVSSVASLGARDVEVINPDGITKGTKAEGIEIKGVKISGYIKDKSATGIEDVYVNIYKGTEKVGEATTTANGYYEKEGLSVGIYNIYAAKNGYIFHGIQTSENVEITGLYTLNFEGIGVVSVEVTDAEVEKVEIYPSFTPSNAIKELTVVYRIKSSGPSGVIERKVRINNASRIRRASGGEEIWIAYYDKKSGKWELAGKKGNGLSGKIGKDVEYLAIARVSSLALAGLISGINVYPNPYIPSRHENGVTFNGVKSGGNVKIYTIRGELVKEMKENGTGRVVWYGKNNNGSKVGSGIYFCIVETTAGTKVKKVGVER